MSLKNNLRHQGFTIVELLIVIVIIGILAAITIVAYNGIQNRGKSAAGQAGANAILKKLEAVNAVKGAYYTSSLGVTGALINAYANATPVASEAIIDTPTSVLAATNVTTSGLTAVSAANGNVVAAFACAGGANIWYWDYAAGASVKDTAGAGC